MSPLLVTSKTIPFAIVEMLPVVVNGLSSWVGLPHAPLRWQPAWHLLLLREWLLRAETSRADPDDNSNSCVKCIMSSARWALPLNTGGQPRATTWVYCLGGLLLDSPNNNLSGAFSCMVLGVLLVHDSCGKCYSSKWCNFFKTHTHTIYVWFSVNIQQWLTMSF